MTETALTTKSSQASGTYPGKGKIDFEEAFKLRYKKNCTVSHIAKHFGVTVSAVTQRLKPANDMFKRAELYPFIQHNEPRVEKLARSIVLQELLKPEKLEKASVNNLGYVYDKLKGAQATSAVHLTIELVFQEAENAAKKLRSAGSSTADIIINRDED